MPKNRHWTVFADDTGDPGSRGSASFGYAVLAVERLHMTHLVRLVAEFRTKHAMFSEAKVRTRHPLFHAIVEDVAAACEYGHLLAGACIVRKDRYDGPYLEQTDDVDADPHFLRNYVVRHALEVLFADVSFDETDTLELVLDRVDYSDQQIFNLRDYLGSAYTKEGSFGFPDPRFITHADSAYVEGLQIANHLAEMALRLAPSADEALFKLASRFLRIKTLVKGRKVTIDPEARKGMGRQARVREEK